MANYDRAPLEAAPVTPRAGTVGGVRCIRTTDGTPIRDREWHDPRREEGGKEKERRESEISRLCTGTPVRAGALRRKEREVRSLIRLTVENN